MCRAYMGLNATVNNSSAVTEHKHKQALARERLLTLTQSSPPSTITLSHTRRRRHEILQQHRAAHVMHTDWTKQRVPKHLHITSLNIHIQYYAKSP
ncbi:hypothetical protein JOB18_012264 [Solea senegalensis]|uniref:Uncharacterized protein n=1 Tax=Solea senegalensis TaxID=28829 RepID=A0AAV6SGI7_SOLSE|nr:hypothetical protein JOB18_012264 [Solea senegalensis]